MGIILDNLWSLALAGVILIVGVVILRPVLRFAWKIVRVVLVLISVILVAGHFLGLLEIIIW
jgi:hypothetical protein